MAMFGDQLKLAREECAMTQAALAQELEIAPQVISDWEKGRRPGPLFPVVYKLEGILGMKGDLLSAVMADKDQITFNTEDLSRKRKRRLVTLYREFYSE